MKTRPLSRVLLTVLLVALCGATEARADQEETIRDNVALFAGGLGLTTAAGLTFGIADLYYAVKGRWMPRGWAIAELSLGSTLPLAGGVLWALIPLQGSARALYLAPFGLSAWFLAHGVLSLLFDRGPPRTSEAPRWWATVTPAPHGGNLALIGGRF